MFMPIVFEPAREQGILRYPLREVYATSWSSHLDVADVVILLLVDRTLTGIVSVGALPGLVGDNLAKGSPVTWGGTSGSRASTRKNSAGSSPR
jgi:hypothetical protein